MVLFEIHQRFKGYSLTNCAFPLNFKSSHPGVFLRKGVLKRCSQITRKHPYQSVISKKLTCNFIEIALWHGCSPVNLLHIFRTPFPKNTSGRLLVKLDIFKTVKVSITGFSLRFNRHKKVTLRGIFRIHSKI